MATTTTHLVSVGEYLGSTYRPDVDYVDGRIEERNLGETDHAVLQVRLVILLGIREQEWGIRVLSEARVQVAATRYRIPDVCIMRAEWLRTAIVREAPMLCIEVLSPRDTVARMRRRVQDFFAMGVPTAWILDPATRTVFVCQGGEMVEQRDGMLSLAGSRVMVSVEDIFATLDS